MWKPKTYSFFPSAKIKQNLKDLLNLEESGLAANQFIKSKTLTVDSATLEMGYIDGPDGREQVTPVWAFNVVTQDIATDGRIIKASRSYVLSAVDGSAVSESGGRSATLFNLPANP